ncbi:MAG: 16S rRNA (cytosine(967)-C(5))-methyltransferase RsmB [Clostridiales Family XIII bacterium]|jgi:16S rRNA (cytosine967-C5)-methyltransferase|nr:16S rRNA (cytosine(967)-C(5))-methyltransferase RsmB [Clostridiales Family XIII bacterium]
MADVNRRTAYFILKDVEENRAYSNVAVGNHIARLRPDSPPFVRELTYGVLRRRITLDYYISQFVKTPMWKIRIPDTILLRMGLYQIIYMNSVPEYAAVNETVSMAKKFAPGRDGFINGVLRSYLRDRDYIELPSKEGDLTNHLSVKYSYEPWIVDMWLCEYGAEETERLLEAGDVQPPLIVRVNTLKTNVENLKSRLEKRGWTVNEGKYPERTLYLEGGPVLSDSLFESGLFSVQDDAALEVVNVLGAKPGETIIDVCAAPGGKTGAIAEDMQNAGRIIAIDLYKRKLKLIEDQMARLDISIVDTRDWDSTVPISEFADKADRVLVDVPCSGLGTVRHKPEIKYKEWGPALEELPGKQLDILTASASYVKPGGVLVYSTCTIAKRENEQVIQAFLKAAPEFERIEARQLLPDKDGMDGFFICKMQRKDTFDRDR